MNQKTLKKFLSVMLIPILFILLIPSYSLAAVNNGKSVLTQNDFTYLGYYTVSDSVASGVDMGWGQGFTHRYVNGQLRFLTLAYTTSGYKLVEFAVPSNIGGVAGSGTNSWSGFSFPGQWVGIWWDEADQRLWTTSAVDYPSDSEINSTKAIYTRSLGSGGAVSNLKGPFGLSGIPARRLYGGAQALPSWFQQLYGTGPYAVGWGGYASRMCGGNPISMGPTMYSIPDPSSFSGDTSSFKTLMDNSSGSCPNPWYPSSSVPTSFDRGVRNTNVNNQYDSWGTAPDGLNRWVWGDSNYNTGMWIETTNKVGFVTVPSMACNKAWYETSTLHSQNRCFEFQVFDPSKLGQVAQGSLQPWNVKPSSRWTISLPGLGCGNSGNDGLSGNVIGATFDPITNKVFLYTIGWVCGTDNRIFVYQINDSTNTTPPPPPSTFSADLNSDGKVNSVDVAMLMGAWGQNSKPKADINQDGNVNSVDAALLMGQWSS
jgi:hypothetical protein